MPLLIAVLVMLSLAGAVASNGAETAGKQTVVTPVKEVKSAYPSVVIYTLSTCPHCREAKQYLVAHNIPFINREVDSDEGYMAELLKIYDEMKVPEQSRGVPLIIIGGKTRLRGFDRQKLETALQEATTEPKK
jgi:glutaredoxin